MATATPTDATPTESTRNDSLRALIVGLGLLAAAAILSLVVPEGFVALASTLGVSGALPLAALGGVLATLSLGVLALVYVRFRPVAIPIRMLTLREWGWVVAGIVLTLLSAIGIMVAGQFLGAGGTTNSSDVALADASVAVLAFAVVWAVIAIGPIEEYLFRGVVQGRLRESFGPVAAIGITSLGFGLSHVPSYLIGGSDLLSLGVLVAVLGIAVVSVIMGAIYERTGNLLVVILAHGLVDALIWGMALASVL